MLRFCFLLLAGLAAAQAIERCPLLASKNPFDPSKFAGHWHLLGYNHRADHPEIVRCQKIDVVSAEVDGKVTVTYNYDYIQNDKPTKSQIISQAFRPGFPGLFLGSWKGENVPTWSEPYVTSILATDYENYAIVVACAPQFDAETKTFGRSLYAQILGRSTSLSEDTYSTLKNVLSGYDISIDLIKNIDNTNC
ncbi:apolipoprotein D-like [Cloeon dipterum]|uniref:apolipoprotein D-like n=1 Tax=Cloeon dipterum TaxID=197152 RepID=UPI00321F894A